MTDWEIDWETIGKNPNFSWENWEKIGKIKNLSQSYNYQRNKLLNGGF